MNQSIIERRSIGVNFNSEAKANVLLWAPNALSADIEIKNKKTFSLNPVERGYWELQTGELHPGDKYLFKIDEKNSYPDPASLIQTDGVHGPSQAYDLTKFQWEDGNWKGIKEEELIIYELHVGTFTRNGTFKEICSCIKYFADLGITAIEIMPVAQFPGTQNWGYDGVYPFAIQDSYGGPEGLQKLVDTFHQANIAVILDVVYNHLGPEGNYFENYAHYFTNKYKTPWGNAINFDDEWCDGVRRFYIENALMWFRDFHIDGLRLDAVHAIKDFGAKHILLDIKEHVKELNKITSVQHFLIGESDLNDVRYINSSEKGGYELDHQWVDEFHHALHSLVTGEKNGYYSDFGDIAFLEKSFNDAFVYDGIYSPYRKKIFGNKTTGQPKEKFIVFAQNHDQIGNRMKGERLSNLVDFETLKLIAGTVFISPFIPMIFMGEEYGETNPFLYFISHGDEKLIHSIREGRKNEFKDFVQSSELFHDPQSDETFNSSKLNLTLNPKGAKAEMFKYYKELIRLKKEHPVITNSKREEMATSSVRFNKILVHSKKYKGHLLIAVMNFEDKQFLIDFTGLHYDSLQLVLNSAEKKWGGNYKSNNKDQENIPSIHLKDFIETEKSSNGKFNSPAVKINEKSVVIFSDVQIF
jgi:maltooligosyltrehalose trehalohydrolase